MTSIHLQNLQFFSFHGHYEEERILGNDYEVNAFVKFEEGERITKLNETIDYSRLVHIIQDKMGIPTQLLETLAMEIGLAIKSEFHQIRSVKISITKIHPPIKNFRGSVAVTWQKEF